MRVNIYDENGDKLIAEDIYLPGIMAQKDVLAVESEIEKSGRCWIQIRGTLRYVTKAK